MDSASTALNILGIEPYYGGSHKAFLDGLVRHSRHRFELFTLPARKWKWRMRGAAINAVQHLRADPRPYDLVFASDFLSLADFAGTCPPPANAVPRIAYFHENQFSYPEQPESARDYQYLFTNVTTCLAAHRVVFNSHYHRTSFIRETDAFLRRMPDCVPEGIAGEIEAKSSVLHVGCELSECDAIPPAAKAGPLVILWNHRWEHDKDPDAFFGVLFELADAGADFRLIVLGERYRAHPAIFDSARERLADRIIHFGYAPDRRAYLELMKRADVAVSTARQEFFGVAAVEATTCGCFPLLPNRLSYPELLPPELHERHLYADRSDLKRRLASLMADPGSARAANLRREMERFSWNTLAPRYDAAFETIARERRGGV